MKAKSAIAAPKPRKRSNARISFYCGQKHRSDGRPIGHTCRTIPPGALQAEKKGDFAEARRIMDAVDEYSQPSKKRAANTAKRAHKTASKKRAKKKPTKKRAKKATSEG